MVDDIKQTPMTAPEWADKVIGSLKKAGRNFTAQDEKKFREDLLAGEARSPGFIQAYYEYANTVDFYFLTQKAHRIQASGVDSEDYVRFSPNLTADDIRAKTAKFKTIAQKNVQRWEDNEIKQDKDAGRTTSSSDGTREQVVKLIREDEKARELALKAKKSKDSKDFAEFVAYVESKLDKFKYDMPGWEGNDFFYGAIIKKDKYTQDGCYTEALQIREILGALKDEKFLPDSTYCVVNGGMHSALAVHLDGSSQPFIIDGWLARTGEAAPTFHGDMKTWYSSALAQANTMREPVKKEEEAFHKNSRLQTPDGKLYKRTYDDNFLSEWAKERKKKDPKFSNMELSGFHSDMVEARQDFVVAYYFLGKNPRLPGSEMNQEYFESLRDRVAYILTKDEANKKANADAGLDADKVRAAKKFNELKPMLETFYQRYGVMPPEQQVGVAPPTQSKTLLDLVSDAVARLGLKEPLAKTGVTYVAAPVASGPKPPAPDTSSQSRA